MLAGAFKGAAGDIEAKQNQRKLVGKLHNTICVPGSEPGDPDVCNWPAVNCAFGDPADKRKITGAEITYTQLCVQHLIAILLWDKDALVPLPFANMVVKAAALDDAQDILKMEAEE
eukprot:g2747.t1